MRSVHTDVVVVGAGPASLVLTELLAGAGKDVTIVERQADPTQVGQSVMLQPSVMGVLKQLGLSRMPGAGPGRIAGIDEYGPSGLLFSGRYADLVGAPTTYGQITTQGAIRRALLDHVGRHPGVSVLASTEFRRLVRDDIGGCRAELANIGDGAVVTLESDWIVAADGKHSTTRALAQIPTQLAGFSHTMYIIPFATPAGYPPIIGVHRRPACLVVTVPEATPGMTYMFTHVAGGEVDHVELIREAGLTVRGADPVMATAVSKGAVRERIMAVAPHTVSATSWRKNGVLLLGDSAHAMHSFGAQGLNVSMQNAALLGDALNQHGLTGDVSAVDAVERRRRPFVDALQRAQHQLDGRFWPPPAGGNASWFSDRFAEFALGEMEFRAGWWSAPGRQSPISAN